MSEKQRQDVEYRNTGIKRTISRKGIRPFTCLEALRTTTRDGKAEGKVIAWAGTHNEQRKRGNRSMEKMVCFEVGERFPGDGTIPQAEGATLELWQTGPVVIIQMPGLRREEIQAFKKSFKRYSYLETKTSPPVAVFCFDFPSPHGMIDTSFDARRVERVLIDDYLETPDGLKNSITFFLLDGPILRAQKLVGLHHEAVRAFHSTIRKQVSMDYTRADFDAALAISFMDDTETLFKKGQVFKHR